MTLHDAAVQAELDSIAARTRYGLADVADKDATQLALVRGVRLLQAVKHADAQIVETVFRTKVTAVGDEPIPEFPEAALAAAQVTPATLDNPETTVLSQDCTRGGRVLVKTIRLRDKTHRRYVSSQPCLVCGRSPADPHHLRFAHPRGIGSEFQRRRFGFRLCKFKPGDGS